MIAKGFTLAELLIALAILGVIATFTIPKILADQQNQQYNAGAKEIASMLAQSYQAYKNDHDVSSGVGWQALTPYFNYVQYTTVSIMDNEYTGGGNLDCSGGCFTFQTGGILRPNYCNSGGGAATNALRFIYDPDTKKLDTAALGNGKSMSFFIYINGRVTTYDGIAPNTCNSCGCFDPEPAYIPLWFNW